MTVSRYRHEALFYAGHDELVRHAAQFARDAIDANEAILIVLDAAKIASVRHELGDAPANVLYADMNVVGANPMRIINAWRDFVVAQSVDDARIRGIGEPISSARGSEELVECHRHEALLNIAFSDLDLWLLCPYDTAALDDTVIDEARRNHPYVREGASSRASDRFPGVEAMAAPFDLPLSDPPADVVPLVFRERQLPSLRRFVNQFAVGSGLSAGRRDDLVLVASELGANSVRHGGGRGELRAWRDGDTVLCDVRDTGTINDPLVGRIRPDVGAHGGRGIWLANQLCDLVQVRSFVHGTAVRVHMNVA